VGLFAKHGSILTEKAAEKSRGRRGGATRHLLGLAQKRGSPHVSASESPLWPGRRGTLQGKEGGVSCHQVGTEKGNESVPESGGKQGGLRGGERGVAARVKRGEDSSQVKNWGDPKGEGEKKEKSQS